MTNELQMLRDKDEIRSAMYRYARGVDRRDYDLVRDAYHPDAHDNHGGYQGGVDGLIEWISRRHAVIEQSMHVIAQTHIDFLSDDVALAESYNVSVQRYPAAAEETIRTWVGDRAVADDERLRAVIYARYIDRFEKREGEWRIARRIVVIEEVTAEIVGVRQRPPSSIEPIRGDGDAVYRLLRA